MNRSHHHHPSRPGRFLHLALHLLLALTTAYGMQARADDAALYGPKAPPGSAFVRVFNASDRPGLDAQIGDEAVPDLEAWNVSDFVFLPAGRHRFAAAGAQQTLDLAAGRYYTAVAYPDAVVLLENAPSDNPLKALLILYNLTDAGGLALRTGDGTTEVVAPVQRRGSGTREVNPVAVPLAVYDGERKVAAAPPVRLARGKAYSLFALGKSDAPQLVWAVN